MGHFSCFELHFFQLWKAKLEKYTRSAPEINILPVPDTISGSRHLVPVTYNSYRSSVYDMRLKFENLPVIVNGKKRILSVTLKPCRTVTDDRRLFHALWRVIEKWLLIPLPLIFCYDLAKNQLLYTFFSEKYQDLSFFHPYAKKWFSAKKGLSNNQQNLLIFGLVISFRNQKILWRPDFWILDFFYDILPLFDSKKWPNLKKNNNFLKFREPKFQKWRKKSKFWLLQVFCIIDICK